MLELVKKMHPSDYFEKEPVTLKYAWRWLRSVLESYMCLRKADPISLSRKTNESQNEDETLIVEGLMKNLGIKNKGEVLNQIYDQISECNVLRRIVGKVRRIMNEQGNLKDLERRLDEDFEV